MPLQPIKILIVDDDEDLLYLLKLQLTVLGYQVELCLDGVDCLDRLLEHKPQIVFLDLSMNGIKGEELCNQIKSDHRFRDTKVLIMSGNYDIKHVAQSCMADGYLTKPVTISMVKNKVATILA